MARYYFDIRDGVYRADVRGTDFPSLEDAKIEACKRIGTLLQSNSEKFVGSDGWNIEVKDPDGVVLFHVAISSSVAG